MRPFYLFITFLLITVTSIFGQKDSLLISFDQKYGITIDHSIQKGQTIFGLSHVYGSNVETTHQLNSDKDLSKTSPNEIIKFQINNKIISPTPTKEISKPLYYKVEALKTMYTIARVYIGQDVKTVMELNNKKDYSLSVGEYLLVGYIDPPYFEKDEFSLTTPIEDQLDAILPMPYSQKVVLTEDLEFDLKPTTLDSLHLNNGLKETPLISRKERGLAMWEATEYGNKELLVMHPSARINSDISLYNPMMKKTVNAKVVGTLPKNSYPQNISVVISPAVANALGALDKKFLVEITYTE